MRTKVAVLGAAVALTTACSATASETGSRPTEAGLSKVLLVGDSIAVGEALPLAAALETSGVGFESVAAEGGGNVVGPFAQENWKGLPAQITAAQADVVIYQITTYDWGSQKEQQAAYQKLAELVSGSGAELNIVTMPPIKADDFYRPHLKELKTATAAARAVAEPGRVTVLDAAEVWGDTYQRERDGKPDRSADGIHTCPQGAARFTSWLVDRLALQYPGFTPADPQDWANTGWSGDEHFKAC